MMVSSSSSQSPSLDDLARVAVMETELFPMASELMLDPTWSAAQQISTDHSVLYKNAGRSAPPATIPTIGPVQLLAILEPQGVFYKDEGGKVGTLYVQMCKEIKANLQ